MVTDLPYEDYVEECGDDYPCNNGFDAAGKILEHLLGPMREKVDDWKSMGSLQKFDQKEMLDDPKLFKKSGFMKYGYVFIPDVCLQE